MPDIFMNSYKLGIDIGSTTVKIALIDDNNTVIFSDYERHFANIQETLQSLLEKAVASVGNFNCHPVITGSGGLTLAKHLEVPFTQEVVAVSTALQAEAPQCDVAIELGGEDAKIIYFTNGVDQRMNGICAGGTGSFIDQMATLLQTDASGLNEYAKNYKSIYPIAARCGVFAKSDIQPLINEGATKEDLSASIFQAVVNQTISGLACGKPIRGNVAFLGGPLHFLSELREAFIRTLNLGPDQIIAPEHSHLFAAIGSAMNYKEDICVDVSDIIKRLQGKIKLDFEVERMEPLFENKEAYSSFTERHNKAKVPTADLASYSGNCYLGIDAGSTTTKVALVGEDGKLLYSFYSSNNGSPLATTIRAIKDIYTKLPKDAKIVQSCSTGYGEALIKSALMLDDGEVETVSHFYAAAFFDPEVDCIIDIGGQDVKVLHIDNGAMTNFQMNDKCAAGTGRFLDVMAGVLEVKVQDLGHLDSLSKKRVEISSTCTVFAESEVISQLSMGTDKCDIIAGIHRSVAHRVTGLAHRIGVVPALVMTGGVAQNEGVVKALQNELGCEIHRSPLTQYNGALGAALYAYQAASRRA